MTAVQLGREQTGRLRKQGERFLSTGHSPSKGRLLVLLQVDLKGIS